MRPTVEDELNAAWAEVNKARVEVEQLREALARIENPAAGVMRSAGEVAVQATVETRALRTEIKRLREALGIARSWVSVHDATGRDLVKIDRALWPESHGAVDEGDADA